MSSEEEIVEAVCHHFDNLGVAVCREIPILGRIADVVALGGDASIVAVECKVRDWQKALVQARRYQGAVTHVYVALGSRCSVEVLARAKEYRVGVLLVEGNDVSEVLVPRPAAHYVPELGDRLSRHLTSVASEWLHAVS